MKTANKFLIFLMLAFSMIAVSQFSFNKHSVYASAISVNNNNSWTLSGSNYSKSLTASGLSALGSATSTLTVTISSKGRFTFKYSNASGTLTATLNGTSFFSPNNTSSLTDAYVDLTADSNTIVFTLKRPSLSTSAACVVGTFAVDTTVVNDITQGSGTTADPFIITNEDQLQDISFNLTAVYKIANDIEITKNFTPLGSGTPFSGTLNTVDNVLYTINGLKMASGNYRALFANTKGATIQNINLTNATITGTNNCSFLIANAEGNTKITNVNVSGSIRATKDYTGGLIAYATNASSATVSNCTVGGTIYSTSNTVGGLSGCGGTFTNCTVTANITGALRVGGLTGGYNPDTCSSTDLVKTTQCSFTNCFIAGEVILTGQHKGNYPYWGLVNGYGAWVKLALSNSGQKINFNYTTDVAVSEITIFNSSEHASGLSVTVPTATNESGYYNFTKEIPLTSTYVGTMTNAESLTSEAQVNGIPGNYGGFTIRFKMADGTYKYYSTLNRAEAKFESNFTVNLDNLTSYVNNFSSISIDQTRGTGTYTTETVNSQTVSVYGTALISNANDFEHLHWIINGGIPTTFKTGEFYNARSVVTISIDFGADIDLTAPRYAVSSGGVATLCTAETENAFLLNTDENGNILNQFYGLGKSEMHPYRGSLYGNNHTLTVNMDFPNAYLMGVIVCATDSENEIVIENLTVNGTISGKYRVGVVGMNDNYDRSNSITFSGVTNNADITAQSQVGGLIGEAQGYSMWGNEPASITIENCVNNGSVTATNGSAGGLVGTLGHLTSEPATVTIINSTNNGDVSATATAGGLVATAGIAVLEGTNVSSGSVTSTSGNENYYVGSATTNTNNGTLITEYDVNLGVANTEVVINGTTYTTDENGNVAVRIQDAQTLDNVTLEVESELLNEPIVLENLNSSSMQTQVVVPVSIALKATGNVYETTNSSWGTFKAIVTFSDNTTEEITVTPNLTQAQLDSNQLVFVNAGFTNNTYSIPSTVTATLKRITDDVRTFVTNASTLINTTSATNAQFLTMGTSVKNSYSTLSSEINGYGTENQERFNAYISNSIQNNQNKNVSESVLNNYYANIVTSADLSALENVSVNYGTYSFEKTLTFTMLSGATQTKQISYSFEKGSSLSATANTNGVSFSVNNVTTYSYSDDVSVTINPIDLLGVSFASNEVVFDNTSKTLTATLSVLTGDSVGCTLSFNNQNLAVNVGTYSVTLASLTGTDAIFYTIPETYTAGTLKITPLIVKLNAEVNKTFEYNGLGQATQFSLTNLSESSYSLSTSDYSTTYTGTDYNQTSYSSSEKPTNVGSYTLTVSVGSNFQISGGNTYSFSITQKQITDVGFVNTLTYNKQAPVFNFQTFTGAISGDKISVTSCTIFNNKGAVSDGINYGSYTVQINSLSNGNYFVENLIKSFTVEKEELTITLNPLSSTYGEDLILDSLTYSVTSGIVYEGDDINIEAKALDSVNAGAHILDATFSNDNYSVTFVTATYTIDRKVASIDFGTTSFKYNGTNQYAKLTLTPSDEVLNSDKAQFNFELYNGENVTTEFKSAGTYTLKLIENQVTNNYDISVKSATCEITKLATTILVNNFEKTYNQQILSTEFSIQDVELTENDKLSDVVTFDYEVYLGEEKVDYSTTLDAGEYDIKLKLTEQSLFNNYDISVTNGTLTISKRQTEIKAQDFEKYYDAQNVSFTAEWWAKDGTQLSNQNLTYTYYLNNNEVTEVKSVNTYTVKVTAPADKNNLGSEEEYSITILTNEISVTLEKTEQVFNAEKFDIKEEISLKANTNITEVLSYKIYNENNNEVAEMVNAGTYTIQYAVSDNNFKLKTESFTITIERVKVQINISVSIIKPLSYSTAEEKISYVYNKSAQAPNIEIEKISETTYELTESDFTITYTGLDYANTNYNSLEKPINVGSYTATISVGNNFEIVGDNTCDFSITPKQITDVSFNNNFTYSKNTPKFIFETFTGLIEGDSVSVTSCKTMQNGTEVEAVNFGSYKLQITGISNGNYYVENLVKDFTIQKEELTITLNPLSSTYGEDLILDNLTYSVTSGTHYEGDELNIQAKALDSVNAGPHTLDATFSNNNYSVTFVTATYTIDKKVASLDFGTTSFEYNGTNQYAKLTLTPSDEVLNNDKAQFNFELYNGENITTEFKYFGSYTLKLIENQVTDNYDISVKSATCEITKFNLTLTANNLTKNFNQQITDFSLTNTKLAGTDSLIEIVSVEYEVYLGEQKQDYSTSLNVGEYDIKLKLTPQRLFNNYDISVVDGKLTIAQRETYIDATDFEKFYDGDVVNFTAKLYGADNQEITNANLTYTYYLGTVEIDEVKEVGSYTVKVSATAGENNKTCEEIFNITIKTNNIVITFNKTQQVFNGKEFMLDYSLTMNAEVDLTNILTYKIFDKNSHEVTEIINAGTYKVEFELADNGFELSDETFTIIISPVVLKVTASEKNSFEYNKSAQAVNLEVSKISETSYVLTGSDYSVTYSGRNTTQYNSLEKPTNVGSYTASVSVGNNFEIVGDNTCDFSITPKQITDVSFNNNFTYCKNTPKFIFETFTGLIEGDSVSVTSCKTMQNGTELEAVNFGSYKLQITGISNGNYYVENLVKDFTIQKEELIITLNPLSSTYGEDLILDNLTYSVTSGTHYEGDELNIQAKALDSVNAGPHTLDATFSNNNYSVTFVTATYTIDKKVASLDFGTTSFEYNGTNQYAKLTLTPSDEVLNNDKAQFNFELYNGENITTEFKYFGCYTLKLIENQVTDNYDISVKSATCEITKLATTILVNNFEKTYNQQIISTEFSIQDVELAENDKLSDVVTFDYEVYLGEEKVDYSTTLDVGEYDIKLKLTEQSLFNNYNILIVNGTLKINPRPTRIEAEDLVTYYTGSAVEFSAKLFTGEQELTNAQFTYTYYLNGTQEVNKAVEVGSYKVKVTATAGENNQTCEEEYNLFIFVNKIKITIVNPEQTYSLESYNLEYTKELFQDADVSNILSYVLLDENKQEISEIKNAGKYYVNFTVNNNGFEVIQPEFEINIKPIDISILVNNRSIKYKEEFDVQESSYTLLSGEILTGESLDIIYSISDFNEIVGSYVLTAKNNNKNYNVSVTDGVFAVEKREIEVTYSGNKQFEYNPNGYINVLTATLNNVVTDNVYQLTYLNSNKQQINSLTDMGTYYLKVELTDTHNYCFKDSEETLLLEEIYVSKKIMNLQIDIASKTYNGIAIKLNGVKFNNEEVSSSLYSVEYYFDNNLISAPINAGNYSVKIVEKIPKNYLFQSNTKTFEILKQDVSVSSIADEYEYSKQEIKPEITLNNVVGDDNVKVDVNYVSSTNEFVSVGDYSIEIIGLTGIDKDNYNLTTYETISYKIIKTPVKVKVKNTKFDFSNVQLKSEQLELSFEGSVSVVETDFILSELPTNAGEHTILITSLNSGIEFDISGFKVFIEKANITGITFNNKIVTYNNKQHSIFVTYNNKEHLDSEITLSNNQKLQVSYTQNALTDVGSIDVTATISNDNYNELKLYATLTIEKERIAIEVSSQKTFTYNKTQQGIEIVGHNNLWYKDLISYSYEGANYSSTSKPVNAGTYYLVISPINPNNIEIENPENQFVINTKAISISSLTEQKFTYSATEKQFIVSYSGVISGDEVSVNCLYENSENLPVNAGTYKVAFSSLSGEHCENYHIATSETATLKIEPYKIKVEAEDKQIVYGESDVELTYKEVELLSTDKFSGTIEREKGSAVNSYVISQGSLSAGENYDINFIPATYSITRREIGYEEFDKEFTYSGNSQVPVVNFTNAVNGDTNIATIQTIGNTTNVGTYTLKFVILNTNYKLPTNSSFEITINKKDISEVILGLVQTEKDFDNLTFEPIVLINGSYNYNISYILNNNSVSEILNAGIYEIKVELDNPNFMGEKTFEFKVNKIAYNKSVIENAKVEISSTTLEIKNITNISVSTDGVNFVSGNTISNLTENTTYSVYVQVNETQNYKATSFLLGEFKTSLCAQKINERVQVQIATENLNIDNILLIKQIIKDVSLLSESEQQILNTQNYQLMLQEYENYFAELQQDIENIELSSCMVNFDVLNTLRNLSCTFVLAGLGMVLIKKRKDEHE